MNSIQKNQNIKYLFFFALFFLESRVTPPSNNITTDDFDMIIKRSNEFHLRTIPKSNLMNKSKKDPLYEAETSRPLWYACEMFALGLHRVIVRNKEGFKTVFSQSDVIFWLAEDVEGRLGDLAHKSVSDLKLGSRDIVSINENDIAIDAFFKMNDQQVSGLVVLNDKGEAVGNFSSSDLKGIFFFYFPKFF